MDFVVQKAGNEKNVTFWPESRMESYFRQAGRSVERGSLVRGYNPPARRGNVRNFSSIPTKYETLLHPSSRKEAFGSAALRFGTDADDDKPGPGAYAGGGASVAARLRVEGDQRGGQRGAKVSRERERRRRRGDLS